MPRHGSLAEQLEALRKYNSRPDPKEPIEPAQTNWTVIAANDNNPEDVTGMHEERRVAMRPSVDEIMREVHTGEIERNAAGQILRIGRLRFSDGTQTERCVMYGIDGKAINGQVVMPAGAMLGMKDVQERTMGGPGQNPGESNAHFENVFDVDHRQFVPSGKRRPGRSYSRDEAIEMLRLATANTSAMPTVTKCPDGIATGTARVADNFIGMKMTPKSGGGSMSWQGIADKVAERETWLDVERSLSKEDKAALNAAAIAKTHAEIGIAVGQSPEYARRKGGRRALMAANQNLMNAIQLASA